MVAVGGGGGRFQAETAVGERVFVREAAREAACFDGDRDQQPAGLDRRFVPHAADRVAVVEADVLGDAQVAGAIGLGTVRD